MIEMLGSGGSQSMIAALMFVTLALAVAGTAMSGSVLSGALSADHAKSLTASGGALAIGDTNGITTIRGAVVSGNQTVNGTSAINGNQTLTGNSTVTGNQTLSGASSVLALTGATSALNVTGAATVGTTLGVTGAVTMTGAATVGTTLGVTGVSTLSGGVVQTVTNINTGTTLTSAQCGVILLGVVGTIITGGAGFAVALPAPARGLRYKFILAAPSSAAAAGNNITVSATGAICLAMLNVNGAPANSGLGGDGATLTTLTFVNNTATGGDNAEFICDGTNWFVIGFGDAAGSVTIA